MVVVGGIVAGCNLLTGAGDFSVGGTPAIAPDAAVDVTDAPRPPPDAGDRDGDTDGAPDAASDAGGTLCSLDTAFSRVAPLTELNTQQFTEESARLTPDELTLFFSSDRDGAFEIWRATRPRRDSAFGAPTRVFGTSAGRRHPSVTADATTLYFKRDGDIFTFQIGQPLSEQGVTLINTTSDEGTPFVLPLGNLIYFASTRDGDSNLYRAALPSGTVGALSDVNSNNGENSAVAAADGSALYFASTRGVPGDANIYVAKSNGLSGFTGVKPVSEINTTATELSSWLSPDRCRLYFASDRNGTMDLFVASKSE